MIQAAEVLFLRTINDGMMPPWSELFNNLCPDFMWLELSTFVLQKSCLVFCAESIKKTGKCACMGITLPSTPLASELMAHVESWINALDGRATTNKHKDMYWRQPIWVVSQANFYTMPKEHQCDAV